MSRSTSQAERLEKLERLINNAGATAGEKAAATAAWERIAGRKYTASASPRNSSSSSRSYSYSNYSSSASSRRTYEDYARSYAAREAARQAQRASQKRKSHMSDELKVDLITVGVLAGIYGGAAIYANRHKIAKAVKNKVNDIRNKFKGGRGASDAQAA